MSQLDARQRQALTQLRDLTNGADDEVAISVLDSVGWDVQRAADLIFGTVSAPAPISPPVAPMPIQAFDIDDSLQAGQQPRGRPSGNAWPVYLSIRPLLSIFAFPLHILSNIFRFVFGILRIPIPQLRFSTLSLYRPLPRRPISRGGADRWIRELEEETGAVCIGRANVPRGLSSATNSAGPSSLSARPHASGEDRKVLPDFTLGSYDEALRTCQKEARIGCIILVSEEHDDVTEFKRTTLTDSTFVKLLYDNNVLVWGGDVQDQEAWSAAEKLQATTYPFVAFLALQPRRSPSSLSRSAASQQPSLTVLSRHQGPSTSPTSDFGPTSARSLIDHLTNQVLPRVTPYLERIQASHRERERDRLLREEQDQAFNDSARRDAERIRGKMEEERREREKDRVKQEEEERKAREQKESAKRDALRMEWRRWARRVETTTGDTVAKELRIAIRLPSGVRITRVFDRSSTLTALYTFVDINLIPSEHIVDEDPLGPPEDGYWNGDLEDCIEARIAREASGIEWWGFQLALAYPRKEIPWRSGVNLGDIDSLKGGGQIVVELLGPQVSRAGDDDEYDTEDSE